MSKKIFVMLLLILVVLVSFVCGKKLAVLPELKKPLVMVIQGNELYILDGVEVYVYSLQDYRLITKFGKRGEGPSELLPNEEIPLNLRLVNGDIFLNSQTKMVYYNKEGKMIKEKTLPFLCMQIAPIGEGFAVVKVNLDGGGVLKLDVVLCDAQLKPIKTLVSLDRNAMSPSGKIVIPTPYIYLHCAGDTLFVTGGNQQDFQIKVFDKSGNPMPSIQTQYDRVELTGSFKNELLDWFKTARFSNMPPEVFQRLYFPDYLPAIRELVVTNSGNGIGSSNGNGGRIYVQTYKQQDNRSEFFVFDFHGKQLNRVLLPTASSDKIKLNHETMFTFHENSYYYLVDNADKEEWELHMETLN